jgi:hypothetical protein
MTAPWDEDLPDLEMSVVGMPELYAYLERLRDGIAATMGGSVEAHQTLHDETAAVDARVTALLELVASLANRKVTRVTARATVPGISLGGKTTMTLTWTSTPAAVPTGVEVWVEATGSLLGAITAALVPGSVTAEGCKVQVSTTLAVTLGSASVRADGIVWA